jgi:proteasome lid subunit RPN8/RPN11
MVTIDDKIWNRIVEHAIDQYPSEACGILAGPEGGHKGEVFYKCRNIYDEMRKLDPATYLRTSREAYLIDGREQKEIFDRVSSDGLEVKSIVHSHIDHDAYFSEEDIYLAAPWGEPLFPEVSYIVISIWSGKFKEANEFIWDKDKSIFEEFKIRGE